MNRAWLVVPLLVLAAYASSGPVIQEPADPLARLMQGNARFVSGQTAHWSALAERRIEVAQTQHPFAIILGCSDSRTAPEQVFDRTVGDLFVVRNAGNVVDDHVLGSMEFAAANLGAQLVVVMGHERCGAVKAALGSDAVPGHVESLVKSIRPALADARMEAGDELDNAVRANVHHVVAQIRADSPVLAELEHAGKLKIVGARYDLDTGEVTLLE